MNRVISLFRMNTIKFSKDNGLLFMGKADMRFITYPYKTDNTATLIKRASIFFYNHVLTTIFLLPIAIIGVGTCLMFSVDIFPITHPRGPYRRTGRDRQDQL